GQTPYNSVNRQPIDVEASRNNSPRLSRVDAFSPHAVIIIHWTQEEQWCHAKIVMEAFAGRGGAVPRALACLRLSLAAPVLAVLSEERPDGQRKPKRMSERKSTTAAEGLVLPTKVVKRGTI